MPPPKLGTTFPAPARDHTRRTEASVAPAGATPNGAVMSALAIWMVATRQTFHARGGLGERGASLVEYALLVALIAVVCIAAVALLGANAATQFSNVGSAIQ